MSKIINVMDMCILYSRNFNIDYFLGKFYGIKQISVNEQYYIDKVNLLKNDFTSFWLSLDDENKEKFIKLVKNYKDDKKEYKINYVDKICMRYENNRQTLMFINNRYNRYDDSEEEDTDNRDDDDDDDDDYNNEDEEYVSKNR
jgi:hypothetical protein